MKKVFTLFTLMILINSSTNLRADTYNPATNILTIPFVQLGVVTYANVSVNLGNYQLLAVQASIASNPPVSTVDNYDAVNSLLTIPLVSVNQSYYQNVEIKLGSNFQVLGVGSFTCITGTGCTAPSNVAPLIVDNGPISQSQTNLGQLVGSTNVAFTTVTICQHGTANCQNLDHILVDTGSMGFRVISSQLAPGLNLPAVTEAGKPVYECLQYVTSYNWGSVNLADVKIAGEVASNIPIQIINANSTSNDVPSSCSNTGGLLTNTVDSFGANGIIGIGNLAYDCGSACTSSPAIPGAYYSCSGSNCQSIVAPLAIQVSNPVTRFSKDNNGTVIQLPAVPAAGAINVSGLLIFGIGTESNNSLGSATTITLDTNSSDANYDGFTTILNGQRLTGSFLDSGSNALYFYDSLLGQCYGSGYACPSSTLSLSADNQGVTGSSSVSFSVANADNLFNNNPNGTAFSNLAVPSAQNSSFDWGLPFFYGRSVFTGIETTSGSNFFVAY